MTAKKAAGKRAAAKRAGKSLIAVRRCAEERALPEVVALPPGAAVGRPRQAPSVVGCGKFVQRQIARGMPRICDMLLTETVEKKSLPALKMLLQLAATYGVQTEQGGGRDMGFARRMMAEFKKRAALADRAAQAGRVVEGKSSESANQQVSKSAAW